MHERITGTRCESVRNRIKNDMELEEGEETVCLFSSCQEATEMGTARGASRRVRHVRIAFATGNWIGKSGGSFNGLKKHRRIKKIL